MQNRRADRRFDAAVAAEVEVRGEMLEGQTSDISSGGVSVQLPAALPEGEGVRLTLILTQDGIEDPNEDPFDTTASVMWNAPSDTGQAMAGLRFVDLQAAQQAQLQRFLAALQSG